MANPVIGFIGLGIMGKAMARNLLKAGNVLVVHNRSRAAVDELTKEGAQPLANPKEVAQASDIVITMLPDGPPVLGASGIPGVWLNLGHGSSGWALSCGSARVLGDLIAGREPGIDLEGLGVERLSL